MLSEAPLPHRGRRGRVGVDLRRGAETGGCGPRDAVAEHRGELRIGRLAGDADRSAFDLDLAGGELGQLLQPEGDRGGIAARGAVAEPQLVVDAFEVEL